MESIAVTKPDMTVTRQEPLSPFGLLTALFTQELVRRNGQAAGMYRPMRLAYLEEDENEAQPAPPEIHFDLDVDLIVNRLMKQTQAKEKTENRTPAQRILERVIVREKEIRSAAPETRRIVIENAGRRTAVSLPVKRTAQEETAAQTKRETVRQIEAGPRQAGEGRSTQKTDVPRRSAGLTQLSRPAAAAGQTLIRTIPERTLPLATQAMSVPAAGGWTPKYREAHPGYPSQEKKTDDAGIAAGSILLPDVMRRRREAALERRETPGAPVFGEEALENALTWAAEDTEQTPETERVLREVRRAVRETLRRNERRGEAAQPDAAAMRQPEGTNAARERAAAEENEARLSAPVPRGSAMPESGVGADTEKAGVTAQEAGGPSAERIRQTAIPAREERAADLPAELAFREAEEKDAADPTGGTVAQETDRVPQAEKAEAAARETNGPTAPAVWDQPHTRAAETLSEYAEAADGAPQAAIPSPAAAPAAAPAQMVFREETAETAAQTAQQPGFPQQTQREARQTPPAAQPARERAEVRNAAEEIKGPRAAAASPRGAEENRPIPSIAGPGTAGEPARTAQGLPETGRPFAAETQADGIRDAILQERGAAEEIPQAAIPAPEEAPAAAAAELIFREEPAETAAQTAQQPGVPRQTQREARQTYPAARPAREWAGERNAAEEIKGPRTATAAPHGTEDHGSVPSVTGPGTAGERAQERPETGRPAQAGTQSAWRTEAIPQEREAAGTDPQAAIPAPAEAPAAAAAELVFREEPAETAAQAAQRPGVPPQTRREARQTYPAAQPARERAGERNAAEEIKGPRAAAAAPRGTEDHGSVPSVTGPETAGEPARTAREIPETGRPFTAGTQADGIRDEIPQERGAAGETPQTAIPAQEEPQTAAPAELVFQNEMKAANPAAPQAAIPQQTQREARQAQAAAQPARERAEERNAAAESREPRAAVVPGGTEIPAEEIPAAEPGRAAIPAQEGPQNAAAPAELVYREKAEELQQSARTAPQDALPAQPRREARQTSPEERPTPEREYERRAAEENGETGTAKDAAGEAAARLAVPAQPEALSGTPAQLVFREETGETPPRGAEAPAAALPVRIVPPDAAARQTAARTASESGRPAQRAVRQTLRDIRVAAPHDAEPEPYAGKTERIAEALPAPEPAQTPGQTELFFAETPKTDARAAEEAAARPTEKPARAEKTERMPAWAKELLEQSGVTDSVQQADVFRSAESAARSGRQITWSAPAMPNPVMKANEDRSGPADLMFREHREAAETPYRPQISDAELQRTADRVYRMIEERLRRELRRSGR